MSLLKSMMLSPDNPLIKQPFRMHRFNRMVASMVGAIAIATTSAMPSIAADPFRSSNPSDIDSQTELAFYEMFRDGDYQEAQQLLATASANEPLAHAMNAAFAYLDEDWDTLKIRTEQTLNAANQLESSDPLRSHLYKAVGHFMEGAYIFSTENSITSIPKTLAKLNDVLSNMRAAEQINATDPELNLLKGFMDLQIAVALPRSNPEEAIRQLETYGAPDYLVNRGIAIAYRDLKQYNKALEYVDAAIENTSLAASANIKNPDLHYLKGQILRNQADDLDGTEKEETLKASVRNFRKAFNHRIQLPRALAEDLGFELCRARDELQERQRSRQDCRDWVDEQLANPSAPVNSDGVSE